MKRIILFSIIILFLSCATFKEDLKAGGEAWKQAWVETWSKPMAEKEKAGYYIGEDGKEYPIYIYEDKKAIKL